jgi:hypothetical protein
MQMNMMRINCCPGQVLVLNGEPYSIPITLRHDLLYNKTHSATVAPITRGLDALAAEMTMVLLFAYGNGDWQPSSEYFCISI